MISTGFSWKEDHHNHVPNFIDAVCPMPIEVHPNSLEWQGGRSPLARLVLNGDGFPVRTGGSEQSRARSEEKEKW